MTITSSRNQNTMKNEYFYYFLHSLGGRIMWFYLIVLFCLTNLTYAHQPKIVVVGAGASGIAAASKLFEHGFTDVTVLEAQDRIGGRVYTTWFDNYWVDVGGQWVHGQGNNIAYQLASPLGVLDALDLNTTVFTLYSSEGKVLPSPISDHAYGVFFNLDDVIESNVTGPLRPYMERAAIDELERFPEINETVRNQLIDHFEKLQCAEDASDGWDEVSASMLTEFKETGGNSNINWKDKGYGLILDIVMKKYPDPAEELPVLNNTLLNAEVVNVNYGLIENKVVVETVDGEKYIADHVIVTPSLGVLKAQYETLFTPPLPEEKMKNIKGLGFGTIAKIYFSFEQPWWHEDMVFFNFLWNEDDRKQYESNPDTKWLLDIIGFESVEHKPRLLCAWMSGPGARYMNTLSDDQVYNASFTLLDKFLGNTYNITTPIGFLRTTWYSNKYFRGTYSYRSIETDEADAWAEELATPLVIDDKPVVLFAGEATSPHHFGTVHGALETGFREADRLKKFYTRGSIFRPNIE